MTSQPGGAVGFPDDRWLILDFKISRIDASHAKTPGRWTESVASRPPLTARRMLGVIVALCAARSLSPAAEPVAIGGRAMGTTWSAKWLQPATPVDPALVQRQLADRLEQLEGQFSTYRPASDLSSFNRAGTTAWIAVPPEVARVAQQARALSALTGGAFDATVAPLLQLWGFGPEGVPAAAPTESELIAARTHVGWSKVEVRLAPPALRKTDPAVALDLSSLAKGYSVDAMSELLADLGLPNHLVQIGGDLRAAGPGPDHHGWRTAIERPVPAARDVARILSLSDRALSTSGNHRNVVLVGGQQAGHIIDPRTGRPAVSTLLAVSVIASSSAEASGLATALLVLGPDEGFAWAGRAHLAGLFIEQAGAGTVQRPTPEFVHVTGDADQTYR